MMSGLRNEPARERRRRQMNSEGDLVTLSGTELQSDPVVPSRKKLTLENHFGWVVQERIQLGDGHFPHSAVRVKSSENVSYALYQNKGTMTENVTSMMKETQTTTSTFDKPPQSDRGSSKTEGLNVKFGSDEARKSSEERRKSKIIHEFYERGSIKTPEDMRRRSRKIHEFYKRGSEKSRSRSKNRSDEKKETDAQAKSRQQGGADTQVQVTNIVVREERSPGNRAQIKGMHPISQKPLLNLEDGKSASNSDSKGGKRPDGQGLRAGAAMGKISQENVQHSTQNTSNPFKIMDKLKPKSKAEYLLDTSSGTNQYLFVSRKRSLKHVGC